MIVVGAARAGLHRAAMARVRPALLLLLAALLLCLEPVSALPAQTATLKRKKKKRGGAVEFRLLNESQPGTAAGHADFVQLATRKYLNNEELSEWLHSYEKRCKSIARLVKIGSSALEKCVAWLAAGRRAGAAFETCRCPSVATSARPHTLAAGPSGRWRSATSRGRRRLSRRSSTWAACTATSRRGAC